MTETASPATKGSSEPQIGHTHRDVAGGWLRPAVFGAMDGVVSNSSLIAGIAAANASVHGLILAGFAGLLAGAFSMAVGEWVSVQSQGQLLETEIEKERAELERAPRAEQAELAAMFRHRGLSRDLAAKVAAELSKDPDEAWRVHVREELGVDPDQQPSPYVAAASSFVTFSIGAFVPILPYLLRAQSLVWSLLLSGIGLLVIGGAVSRFTARPLVVGALRQLTLGAIAVAVTFGVGHLIGAGVSG